MWRGRTILTTRRGRAELFRSRVVEYARRRPQRRTEIGVRVGGQSPYSDPGVRVRTLTPDSDPNCAVLPQTATSTSTQRPACSGQMPNGPAVSGGPVFPSIRARCAPARSAGWVRFRDHPNWSSAQKQRLDDLRTRPADRATSRESLLAQRVLAREPKDQPRRWSVERRRDGLEPSDFFSYPAATAGLRVPGRKRAAIGLVHGLTGEITPS